MAPDDDARLGTATALTLWGALVFTAEHTLFSLPASVGGEGVVWLSAHARYHSVMASVFVLVAGLMVATLAVTLLREGRRAGWFALLAALLVGGGSELATAATVFPHGIPPRSILIGLAIYTYPLAWAAALALAWRPVFGPRRQAPNHRGAG